MCICSALDVPPSLPPSLPPSSSSMLLAGQSRQRQRKLQELRKEVSEAEEKYQDLLQENGRCRLRACHGHQYCYSTFNSVGYNTHVMKTHV